MKVAAVVLAAGESRRMGEPKQCIRLNGETMLDRAVRICHEAGCKPVVVVLGAFEQEIRAQCRLTDTRVVVNEGWDEGMAASVRAGMGVLEEEDVAGCVLLTCDMPSVSAHHLKQLMTSEQVTASSYAGRRGVPAYFPAWMFLALLELRGDAGARELLRDANHIELPGGELDMDTPADLERVRVLYGEPS